MGKAKVSPVMRITVDGGLATIETLIRKRTKIHGFGTFFCYPKRGEISVNQAAYKMLSEAIYKRGLMGIEVFVGPIVSYGSPVRLFTEIPISEISVDGKARDQLLPLLVVED